MTWLTGWNRRKQLYINGVSNIIPDNSLANNDSFWALPSGSFSRYTTFGHNDTYSIRGASLTPQSYTTNKIPITSTTLTVSGWIYTTGNTNRFGINTYDSAGNVLHSSDTWNVGGSSSTNNWTYLSSTFTVESNATQISLRFITGEGSPTSGVAYWDDLSITQSTGPTQTNYQMKITVNYGSGTDSPGNIYCGGNVKSDFSDIRFTDSSGNTLINYWIDPNNTVNGSYANIWMQIPSIPTGNNSTSIYFYYNNPTTTTTSNGTTTFNLYDDFTGTNGQAVNSSKWTTYLSPNYNNGNSISIQNNQVQIVAHSNTYAGFTYSLMKSVSNFNFSNTGIWVQLYIPSPSGSPGAGGWHGYCVLTNSTGNEWSPSNQFGINTFDSQNPHVQFINIVNGTQTSLYDYTPSNRNLAFSLYGNNATLYEWSGSSWVQKWAGSATTNFTSGYLEIADYSDQNYALVQYSDNVIIHNYVSPSPAWSTVSAEQGSITAIAFLIAGD